MDVLLAAAIRHLAPKVVRRYLVPLIEKRLSKRGVDVDLDRVFDLVVEFETTNLSGEQKRKRVLKLLADVIQEHGESYARLLIEMALARARSGAKGEGS